jgi:hypothetical protein
LLWSKYRQLQIVSEEIHYKSRQNSGTFSLYSNQEIITNILSLSIGNECNWHFNIEQVQCMLLQPEGLQEFFNVFPLHRITNLVLYLTTCMLPYKKHAVSTRRTDWLMQLLIIIRKQQFFSDIDTKHLLYCHVCRVTIHGVWIGWLDLLTPYTHHSELQAITRLSLIYTLYNSLLHQQTSGLCPLQSPLTVSWHQM